VEWAGTVLERAVAESAAAAVELKKSSFYPGVSHSAFFAGIVCSSITVRLLSRAPRFKLTHYRTSGARRTPSSGWKKPHSDSPAKSSHNFFFLQIQQLSGNCLH
jgi:hypothetical protein